MNVHLNLNLLLSRFDLSAFELCGCSTVNQITLASYLQMQACMRNTTVTLHVVRSPHPGFIKDWCVHAAPSASQQVSLVSSVSHTNSIRYPHSSFTSLSHTLSLSHKHLFISLALSLKHIHSHTGARTHTDERTHTQLLNFNYFIFTSPSNSIYNIFGKHDNHFENSSFILSYRVPVAKQVCLLT